MSNPLMSLKLQTDDADFAQLVAEEGSISPSGWRIHHHSKEKIEKRNYNSHSVSPKRGRNNDAELLRSLTVVGSTFYSTREPDTSRHQVSVSSPHSISRSMTRFTRRSLSDKTITSVQKTPRQDYRKTYYHERPPEKTEKQRSPEKQQRKPLKSSEKDSARPVNNQDPSTLKNAVLRAINRAQDHALKAAVKEQEEAAAAELAEQEQRRGTEVDVRKSILKAQSRVWIRQLAAVGCSSSIKNQIAIIGAGPVGLWVALLLCRQFFPLNSSQSPVGTVGISIYEKRPLAKHGSRNILLCFSTQTETIINKALSSWKTLAPSVRLCELETLLREELLKYSVVTFYWEQEVQLGESAGMVNGKHYDAVFVANGKRANEGRQQVMHCTKATILSYTKGPKPKASVYTQSILRNENIIIREFDKAHGWVWLLQYENKKIDPARTYPSFKDILDPDHHDYLLFKTLGETICPEGSVGVIKTETSYWGITKEHYIVNEVKNKDGSSIICYVGDSCCGKPFYLGTTLQFHIYDMVFLITGISWRHNLEASHFRAYEQRMRGRIQSFMAKKRNDASVSIEEVIDAHVRSVSPSRRSNSPTNRCSPGRSSEMGCKERDLSKRKTM